VWYIHADDLPARTCQSSVPAHLIIFPRYAPDLTPRLLPLNANDTLQLLIENSVNFPQFAGKSLNLLSRVVADAAGYRLESNNLDASVQLVNQLMAAVG
jgi:hypothetical protein